MTSRSSPPSGASRFVPLPMIKGRASHSQAMDSSSTSCSLFSGNAIRFAGPPTRKEVCFAMGSSFKTLTSGK